MSKALITLVVIFIVQVNSIMAQAEHDHSHHNHDHHAHLSMDHHDHEEHVLQYAPLSVSGGHMHPKGGLMFSYKFMPMWMKGCLTSSKRISQGEIYQKYMVAPEKMQMRMHMVGVMYAPFDFLTIMGMGNYISNTMELRSEMSGEFKTQSGGIGDASISFLVKVLTLDKHSIHGDIGTSIPIGDINQTDKTPMHAVTQLGYPMQLGSRTWDPFLGLTYLGFKKNFSWGVQSRYKYRVGKNEKKYTQGNIFKTIVWADFKPVDIFSFSTSLSYFNAENIEGEDRDMHSVMMPLLDAQNSGRGQIDFGLGLNFYVMHKLRVGVDFGIPLFQKVNKIQMKNTFMGFFGVQYTLGH